jgi:hypothetical protein
MFTVSHCNNCIIDVMAVIVSMFVCIGDTFYLNIFVTHDGTGKFLTSFTISAEFFRYDGIRYIVKDSLYSSHWPKTALKLFMQLTTGLIFRGLN